MSMNPFIPQSKARIAIVDGRASDEIKENLKKYDLEIIETCKCTELYDSISYHPDMVMHPINEKTLIVAPNVYNYYKERLSFYGIKVIMGEKKLDRNYPENIAYNVARVRNFAVHNTKYTDEKLKYYIEKEGIDFIHVKQGYTKCSIAIIKDNAIITSDLPIYKKIKNHSIDVLFIKEGCIDLPGLNYGFIGGASGMFSQEKLFFSGKIDEHPSYNNIKLFLRKHSIKPIFLSNERIIDVGSIIVF